MINNRMSRMRQAFYNDNNGDTVNTPQKPSPSNVRSIQKRLQKISFALTETVLYLDAYPNCEKAKSFYRELFKERDMLLKALSDMGMPMTAMQVEGNEWTWTNGPWPWEYEANV